MSYACGRCGTRFADRGSQRRRAHRQMYYCSRSCAFWDNVVMPEPDGCLLWIGPIHKGYGVFRWQGEQTGAHQEAWRQTRGSIPKGLDVLHRCPGRHNKSCVLHLYVGTQADNARDMVEMGQIRRGDQHGLRLHPERAARGERHGSAKLTDMTVAEIRKMVFTETMTYEQIGKKTGISKQTVCKIVLGRIRKYQGDQTVAASRFHRESE